MISFDSVSFSYGDKAVLNEFSMRIETGEKVCLFGTSGSGKTTVLRLIMGLEKPDSGSIKIGGRISVVFQEDRLLPYMTVLQNTVLFSTADRAKENLSRLGLGGDTDKYPSELSGGMARRAALARALSAESDVLILDEPFDGLDAENTKAAIALIKEYAEGRTIVLVSHERNDAEALDCRMIEI